MYCMWERGSGIESDFLLNRIVVYVYCFSAILWEVFVLM